MKKKNGFIAISLIYSFFLIFITMMLAILANYAYNRNLTKQINNSIIEELENGY